MNILPIAAGKFRTFPMQLDVYGMAQFGAFRVGGSLGGARVAAGSALRARAAVTANQGDQWNLISRTPLHRHDIIRSSRTGGRSPEFALRRAHPEHTMWVRQATNTDRESSQEHGVARRYGRRKATRRADGHRRQLPGQPDSTVTAATRVTSSTRQLDGRGWRELARHVCQNRRDTNQDLRRRHQVHGAMARAGFGEKVRDLGRVGRHLTSRREPVTSASRSSMRKRFKACTCC